MPSIEWKVYVDDDGDSHLIVSEAGKSRIATKEECQNACKLLNEEGSTVVRLECKTLTCPGKGGWIERTRLDATKNMYICEGGCGRPMER